MDTQVVTSDCINLLKLCAGCGYCASFCSVDTGSNLRPIPSLIAEGLLKVIGSSADLLEDTDVRLLEETYRCGLCGRCSSCRYNLDVVQASYTLRRLLAERSLIPKPLVNLQRMIRESRNAFGADISARSMWVDYVGLTKIRINRAADTLYFVGCTSSYRAQGQDVAYAASLTLNSLGEDWTILGADEWCCGAPILAVGDWMEARELAKHNTEFIESLGVKTVVSSCPSCVNTLRNEYPKLIGRQPHFKVQHIVELVDRRLDEGAFKGVKRSSMVVAYHDPCQLVRRLKVHDEPRRILAKIADRVVEFREAGADARCCGAGVGDIIEVVDPSVRLEAAGRRLFEAGVVGADVVVSACPDCKIALSEAARRVKSSIEVVDILEMLALQAELM